MNASGVYALVTGVCVAALTVSGCGTQSTETGTQGELPPISKNLPDGYDRWEELDGGPSGIPEMDDLAAAYGVAGINLPASEYTEEYLGVAQLERYCVVGFHSPDEPQETGLMDVTVLSRFNKAYTIFMPALPPENIRTMREKYRPLCSGESELSDIPSNQAVQGA